MAGAGALVWDDDGMPRANRRRRDLESRPMSGSGEVATESYAGKSWHVRRLTGASSSREYRCPGCHQGIVVGTAHVVAWPAQGVGGIDERRHWHTRCWAARHAARPEHPPTQQFGSHAAIAA